MSASEVGQLANSFLIMLICQQELDVTRCTWHLLTGTQRIRRLQMEHKRHKKIARVIRKKQFRLASCIQQTLQAVATDDPLFYYQGYHSLACIFLSTLRDGASPSTWLISPESPIDRLDLPSRVLLEISQSHLRDFMQETFQPIQSTLSLIVFPLLALLDPEVHDHLAECDMAPFFLMPWMLSWFAHDIRDTALVKRIFDAFISSHPAFPLYVCIAMILHPYNRAKILETECDFAALHHSLTSLPKNSSGFGWKYQPGTGYVSDHEDEEDATTGTGTTSDEKSIETEDESVQRNPATEGEMVLVQAGIDFGKDNGSKPTADIVSLNSSLLSSLQEESAPVPFDDLFDMATQFMHRMPPRRLIGLAQRCHGKDTAMEMLCAASIGKPVQIFMDPASWAIAPTAPALWLLRDEAGLSARKSLKRRRDQKYHEAIPSAGYVRFLRQEQRVRSRSALLASGMALSRKEEKRRIQRERVGVFFGTLLVAILAWRVADVYAPSPVNNSKFQGRMDMDLPILHEDQEL